MSPFIVKRIHKERVFILDNELLTKEDLLKKENWNENIHFSSIEDNWRIWKKKITLGA